MNPALEPRWGFFVPLGPSYGIPCTQLPMWVNSVLVLHDERRLGLQWRRKVVAVFCRPISEADLMKSFFVIVLLAAVSAPCWGQDWKASLTFHASFDEAADADYAKGDSKVYTAATVAREKVSPGLPKEGVRRLDRGGRHGGYLAFDEKIDPVVMYRGKGNVALGSDSELTVSFWMKLDPAVDLPPGYVDPLQITDKKWNDSSLFVDFTQENPRQFRLGVFSDYRIWNPNDTPWDDVAEKDRPMVPVSKLPFAADRWTHVVFTLKQVNANQAGMANLYLDGKLQGELKDQLTFTWDPDQVAVMLGIYYVGGIDDFAIFNRALTAEEVGQLLRLEEGVAGIRP